MMTMNYYNDSERVSERVSELKKGRNAEARAMSEAEHNLQYLQHTTLATVVDENTIFCI